MNVHPRRPDRSPEAIEKRRKAAEQARAANIRQGSFTILPSRRRPRGMSPATSPARNTGSS